MKTNYKKIALALCMLSMFALQSWAQWDSHKMHITVDWQVNAPYSTGFADKISGWGMNFEGTYNVSPHWALGAFINFHTNHEYVGRQTLQISPTESLTTDQQRSAYQLPFGFTSAYTVYNGKVVKPYFGVKLGAVYTRYTTYCGTGGVYDNPWGFYASPEIGLQIFPFQNKRFGFHVAGYYSYMTNQAETLTHEGIDGQNNAGFRLGVIF